jgi:hypothetical protein
MSRPSSCVSLSRRGARVADMCHTPCHGPTIRSGYALSGASYT